MKKRRFLLLTLLAVLLIAGLLVGLLTREYRQEKLNKDLIAAIREGDTNKAQAVLKAGADPNTRDHSKDKPLSLIERFLKLFENGFQSNKDDTNRTALLDCIYIWRDYSALEANTPLGAALLKVRPAPPPLIEVLLNSGADPNLPSGTSKVSPAMAAAETYQPHTLHLLIQYRCNLDQTDIDGKTALHYAVSRYAGSRSTVSHNGNDPFSVLLDSGANINAQDVSGLTPLHLACQLNSPAIVQALIQRHANLNLGAAPNGRTPLDEALMLYHPYAPSPLQRPSLTAAGDNPEYQQIVELLRKAGAKTRKELSSQSAAPPKR